MWYAQMWDGTFRDWDLAIEVATLPDELWEGEDALAKVAEAIRGIEAKRDLLDQITALKGEVSRLRAANHSPSVGHNQGPPLENQEVALRGQIELVWPVLEELEQEVEKSEPDPERIAPLAQKLWAIAVVIAKYCGGKLDVALEKAAETAGEAGTKWAIKFGVGTYLSTNEGVQSVAKAAWKFAMSLAAG